MFPVQMIPSWISISIYIFHSNTDRLERTNPRRTNPRRTNPGEPIQANESRRTNPGEPILDGHLETNDQSFLQHALAKSCLNALKSAIILLKRLICSYLWLILNPLSALLINSWSKASKAFNITLKAHFKGLWWLFHCL